LRVRREQTRVYQGDYSERDRRWREGQDPFERLNIEDYVAAGYERETAKQYIDTLSMGLSSDNVDGYSISKSGDIYNVLDR
jgi:hypothetical protein